MFLENVQEHNPIMSLRIGEFVEDIVVNQHLLHLYYNTPRRQGFYYLDSVALQLYVEKMKTGEHPAPAEVELNRERFRDSIREESAGLLMRPVVTTIIPARNHYFVILLDYQQNEVLTFGRKTRERGQKRGSWDSWHGQWVWEHVARLFGWWDEDDMRSVKPTVTDSNWFQVRLQQRQSPHLILWTHRTAQTVGRTPCQSLPASSKLGSSLIAPFDPRSVAGILSVL
jgi:hypothetical protein